MLAVRFEEKPQSFRKATLKSMAHLAFIMAILLHKAVSFFVFSEGSH